MRSPSACEKGENDAGFRRTPSYRQECTQVSAPPPDYPSELGSLMLPRWAGKDAGRAFSRRTSHMASFSVVSNVSATNAQANLNVTNLGLQQALQRLSSGYRINKSGD